MNWLLLIGQQEFFLNIYRDENVYIKLFEFLLILDILILDLTSYLKILYYDMIKKF